MAGEQELSQEERQELSVEDVPRMAPADELVECPDCDAMTRVDKLGTHRFKAHGVDRRVSEEPSRKPTPRKREREQDSDDQEKDKDESENGDRSPKRKRSRWSELRWG